MKTRILKTAIACGLFALGFNSAVRAQAFTENFDDINTLPGSGWFQQNNSAPSGINPVWFQGNPVEVFPSYNGAANAYIACNFNSTTGGNGTISNWLLTPNRIFRNGDVVTFYTRKHNVGVDYPERMEVRLSTNGASTNVSTSATGLGDFTTLLLSINPTLVTGVYPREWTQFTITISGLPAPTSGRIAFRYFITGGGPSGANGDYIGLDNVVYTPYVCPAFTMDPAGPLTGGTAGATYSIGLGQSGALGTPNFAITAGALPPGLTLAANGTISGTPTATGTFNFTVTVNDASGCSGSQSYSITVVCPANPITFGTAPVLCDNEPAYVLTEGLPGGGTYSGTGVSGGEFDPTAGTQTVTYDYTDPYGCSYNANYTVTVNTAPTVTLDPIPSTCDNAGLVALTGGSPAGGTFSGTGVTADEFDAASGDQVIIYTYTDANGCTNEAAQSITVNTAPTVTQSAISAICDNSGVLALTGGSPAGGTYSGTGVTAGEFDPASGTQTVTYTYTDGNNCTNDESVVITVHEAPEVTQNTISAVCENSGVLALTGGSPVGGTYSGTGVTGTDFDPTAGTQTITYSYTDTNSCTSAATTTITVNDAPAVTFTSPVADVCLNHSPLTLSGGMPAGGTYSGTGVSGGVLTPATAGAGSHVITYSYTDANNCDGQATFTINVSACLGLDENEAFGLEVYPNPTTGLFTVSTTGMELSIVSVMDIQGKTVPFETSKTASSAMQVDLSNQVPGIYFVNGAVDGQPVKFRIRKH